MSKKSKRKHPEFKTGNDPSGEACLGESGGAKGKKHRWK